MSTRSTQSREKEAPLIDFKDRYSSGLYGKYSPPPHGLPQVAPVGNKKKVFPVPPVSVPFPGPEKPPPALSWIQTLKSNASAKEKYLAQKELEMLMVRYAHCNPIFIDNLRVKMFQLDTPRIAQFLDTTDRFDSNFQRQLGCTADAIVYDTSGGDSLDREVIRTTTRRVHQWLSSIKQVGNESVAGYALRTGIKPTDDLFVIKAPRSPSIDDLIHEAAVGFYVTNPLREYLPNFVYTYSVFFCSPPALQDRKALTWCSGSSNNVTYLVLENVRDSVSLGEFLLTCTGEEFIEIYIQVLNALNAAYKFRDFTHYDLHVYNVLIRQLNNIVSIPYYGTMPLSHPPPRFITSKIIATIIDFGFSHFKYDDVNFDNRLFSSYEGPDISLPMTDAFLLIYQSSALLTKEIKENPGSPDIPRWNTLLEVIGAIYSFFISKDPTLPTFIGDYKLGGEPRRVFPPTWKVVSLDDLISYMEQRFNLLFQVSPPENSIVLYRDPSYLATFDQFLSQFVQGDKAPTSLFEYCDAVQTVRELQATPVEKDRMMDWLNDNFSVTEAFDRELPLAEAAASEVQQELEELIIPDLKTYPVSQLLERFNIVSYHNILTDLLSIKEKWRVNVDYWLESANCALVSQKGTDAQFNKIHQGIIVNREIIASYTQKRNQVAENLVYIKNLNVKRVPGVSPDAISEAQKIYNVEAELSLAAL